MQNFNAMAGGYLEHFSLSRDPFEPSEVFFPGAGRQLLLDQLLHLSQFSSAVLVVSGASGSGRTSFAKKYAVEVKAWATSVAYVDVAQLHQPEELFFHLAKAYGLQIEGNVNSGELLVELRQTVQQVPLVFVCDGAESLDDGVLSALLSLLQGLPDQSPLRVLLTGDEALVSRLDAFEMLDVLVQDWQLDDLSKTDVAQYLSFLLTSVGGREELFSADELERLWQLSDGLPGRLSLPARELLVDKAAQAAELISQSDRSVSVWSLGAAACCAAFLVVAFLYRDDMGQQSEPEKSHVTLEPAVAVRPAVSPASPVLVKATDRPPSELPQYAQNAQLGGSVALPVIAPTFIAKQVVIKQVITEGSLEEPASSEVFLEHASRLAPASAGVPVQISKSEVAAVVRPVLPTPEAGDMLVDLDVTEKHLMSLDKKHFVLQVLGAGSRESVEQFVEAQVNSSELYIFVTQRNGKPWYTVVLGDYPSRTEARVAIKGLPEGQRLAGAWPRSLEEVHSAIGEK